MSVLVSVKVPGDLDTFTRSLDSRAEDFRRFGESARAAGAIHHRFALGPDYVMVVDEWESPEQFQSFFSSPELQAFIGEIGGDTSAPPDFTVGECIESPDQF